MIRVAKYVAKRIFPSSRHPDGIGVSTEVGVVAFGDEHPVQLV